MEIKRTAFSLGVPLGTLTPRKGTHYLRTGDRAFSKTDLLSLDRLWRKGVDTPTLAAKVGLRGSTGCALVHQLFARARLKYPGLFPKKTRPMKPESWVNEIAAAKIELEKGASLHRACLAARLPYYVGTAFLTPPAERFLGATPHREVVAFLAEHPQARHRDLATFCGVPYATARLFCRRGGLKVNVDTRQIRSKL